MAARTSHPFFLRAGDEYLPGNNFVVEREGHLQE